MPSKKQINLLLGALLGALLSQSIYAGGTRSTGTSSLTINGVSTSVYTYASDGYPYYGTGYTEGAVSGWGYLNSPIKSNPRTYSIPSSPTLIAGSTSTTPIYTAVGLANDFGVALDGVPFDPLTSTCGTTSGSASNTCQFRLEGRLAVTPGTSSSSYTTARLGFDVHNGHLQSNGTYHYHGIPCGMSVGPYQTSTATAATSQNILTCNPMATNAPWAQLKTSATIVGYARDGYPVVVKAGVYSSYSVVTTAATSRPTTATVNALGSYSEDFNYVGNGSTFTQASVKAKNSNSFTLADWTYTGPSTIGTSTSALGLCNETANSDSTVTLMDGVTVAKYAYYLTPNFPMIPRCLIGNTDGPTVSGSQNFTHAGAD